VLPVVEIVNELEDLSAMVDDRYLSISDVFFQRHQLLFRLESWVTSQGNRDSEFLSRRFDKHLCSSTQVIQDLVGDEEIGLLLAHVLLVFLNGVVNLLCPVDGHFEELS